MPRIRTIKPEIHADGRTGKLSDRAFRLFVGLLNFCDDYGVMMYDPDQVKAAIIPHIFEDSETGVVPFIEELHRARLIALFEFVDQKYLWIRTFSRHQYVEKPSRPLLDGWLKDKTETAETFCKRCIGKIYSPTTPRPVGELAQKSEVQEPNSPTPPLPVGNPAEVRNGMEGKEGKELGREGTLAVAIESPASDAAVSASSFSSTSLPEQTGADPDQRDTARNIESESRRRLLEWQAEVTAMPDAEFQKLLDSPPSATIRANFVLQEAARRNGKANGIPPNEPHKNGSASKLEEVNAAIAKSSKRAKRHRPIGLKKPNFGSAT